MIRLFHMEERAISRFEATCLAVVERVRRTRQLVLVAGFGVTVAETVPPSPLPQVEGWLGCMAGTAEIIGDIVAPAVEADKWEAIR